MTLWAKTKRAIPAMSVYKQSSLEGPQACAACIRGRAKGTLPSPGPLGHPKRKQADPAEWLPQNTAALAGLQRCKGEGDTARLVTSARWESGLELQHLPSAEAETWGRDKATGAECLC